MSRRAKRKGAMISAFVGTSLDGFIARKDGELDWMEGPGGEGGGDYGFSDFMARIEALVMGRATFEKVLTFEGWPYGDKPVIVLTHGPPQIPPSLSKTVESMSGTPEDIVERLGKRGLRRLYVDGGRTIQAFLAAGLVDELIVSRLPVLIGTGTPLFGPLPRDVRVQHVKTRAFPGGMVQSTYRVVNRAPGTSTKRTGQVSIKGRGGKRRDGAR